MSVNSLPLPALKRFGERLEWAIGYLWKGSKADFARAVERSPQQVSNWLALETAPSEDTVRMIAERLEVSPAWLRYGVSAPSGTAEVREPSGEYTPAPASGSGGFLANVMQEIEAGGGLSDVERLYISTVQKIEASDATDSMKVMRHDSFASTLGRLGNIIAERAAEARARAIEKAESASESRAKAIERAEESADARVRAITGQQTGDGEVIPPEEYRAFLEWRRRPDRAGEAAAGG